MSFQIICDNCGATQRVDANVTFPKPNEWESVPLSGKEDGITKHHCPECIRVKEAARTTARIQVAQMEEEALAARRNKGVN